MELRATFRADRDPGGSGAGGGWGSAGSAGGAGSGVSVGGGAGGNKGSADGAAIATVWLTAPALPIFSCGAIIAVVAPGAGTKSAVLTPGAGPLVDAAAPASLLGPLLAALI